MAKRNVNNEMGIPQSEIIKLARSTEETLMREMDMACDFMNFFNNFGAGPSSSGDQNSYPSTSSSTKFSDFFPRMGDDMAGPSGWTFRKKRRGRRQPKTEFHKEENDDFIDVVTVDDDNRSGPKRKMSHALCLTYKPTTPAMHLEAVYGPVKKRRKGESAPDMQVSLCGNKFVFNRCKALVPAKR